MHKWKHASLRKLSARKRGIFVDKKPSASVVADSFDGNSFDLPAGECVFFPDVVCSYRLTDKEFTILHRCMECSHHARFMREMEEEDEKTMNEIDEIRKRLPV
jgi:hypothetical protein